MVRRHRVAVLCAAAVMGSLAAGCDTSEQGGPVTGTTEPLTSVASPTPNTSVQTTATLPFAGAPKVANPLDATKFMDDPCLALTSAQLTQLNVGAGKISKAYLGMACDWANPGTGGSVSLQFLSQFRQGLSAIYRANDEHKYGKFEPIGDLAGLPAVIANPPKTSNDTCIVYIGISDDLAADLSVVESREKVGKVDPCDVAKAVGPLVVQTMKAGA